MRKEKKKKLTFKKENLATWGEEDVDFNEEEKKDEKVLLCLMAFDNDLDEVYDSILSYSSDDDDIEDLYHELYDSLLVKDKKDLKCKIIENDVLIDNVK